MFSRPVRAGLKPAPSSIRGVTGAVMLISPEVGAVTPAKSLRRVLFPEPFNPIIPTVSPALILRLMLVREKSDFGEERVK